MSADRKESWSVTGGTKPLCGEARVPGDKSIGHRAVLFAALADGKSHLIGLSGGEDNRRTAVAMEQLGARIVRSESGVTVEGAGLTGLRAASGDIDCGNSGTTMRLLAGLLAGRAFSSRLVGDQYLERRPMRRVAAPLTQMGGRVEGQAGAKPGEIYAPLSVGGIAAPLHGMDYTCEVASAQVKSAILLAGLIADGVTRVCEPAQTRDHTERMLAAMGAPLSVSSDSLVATLDARGWDRKLAARDVAVPGDLSSAAFLLGAALLVPGSELVVRGVGVNPTRTGLLDALSAMGADISLENARLEGGEPVADLVARASSLHGTTIAGELAVRSIDELPLLAALAAHATGTTHIRDAAELRVKESDRIAATCALLRAFGVPVEEHKDGLSVEGGAALHPGTIDSHGDHRIAMAAAICALTIRGETQILDVTNVATSFPPFAAILRSLGVALA